MRESIDRTDICTLNNAVLRGNKIEEGIVVEIRNSLINRSQLIGRCRSLKQSNLVHDINEDGQNITVELSKGGADILKKLRNSDVTINQIGREISLNDFLQAEQAECLGA